MANENEAVRMAPTMRDLASHLLAVADDLLGVARSTRDPAVMVSAASSAAACVQAAVAAHGAGAPPERGRGAVHVERVDGVLPEDVVEALRRAFGEGIERAVAPAKAGEIEFSDEGGSNLIASRVCDGAPPLIGIRDINGKAIVALRHEDARALARWLLGAAPRPWQPGDPEPPNAAPFYVHAPVPGPDPWATACGRRVPRDALAWPGSSEPDCPACRVECGLEEEAPEPVFTTARIAGVAASPAAGTVAHDEALGSRAIAFDPIRKLEEIGELGRALAAPPAVRVTTEAGAVPFDPARVTLDGLRSESHVHDAPPPGDKPVPRDPGA